jgi:very-short-patch-repair endonuclease
MYKQPEPSPIEELFWATAKGAIPELERKVWIGRCRVDFLVRHKKVIIELYGYQWHSTKEKLKTPNENAIYNDKDIMLYASLARK